MSLETNVIELEILSEWIDSLDCKDITNQTNDIPTQLVRFYSRLKQLSSSPNSDSTSVSDFGSSSDETLPQLLSKCLDLLQQYVSPVTLIQSCKEKPLEHLIGLVQMYNQLSRHLSIELDSNYVDYAIAVIQGFCEWNNEQIPSQRADETKYQYLIRLFALKESLKQYFQAHSELYDLVHQEEALFLESNALMDQPIVLQACVTLTPDWIPNLNDLISNGMFSQTYKAWYQNEPVTVKLIDDIAGYPTIFERDIHLYANLYHVNLLEFFQFDHISYELVSEAFAITLAELLSNIFNKSQYDPSLSNADNQLHLLLLQDISAGLMFLHSLDIIHGFHMPEHIVLTYSSSNHQNSRFIAKLSEFHQNVYDLGVLDLLKQDAVGLRRKYVAPEVLVHCLDNEPILDDSRNTPHASIDIYSFGVIAREIIIYINSRSSSSSGASQSTTSDNDGKSSSSVLMDFIDFVGNDSHGCLANATNRFLRPNAFSVHQRLQTWCHKKKVSVMRRLVLFVCVCDGWNSVSRVITWSCLSVSVVVT